MVKCHLNNSRILENKIVSDQYLSYGKTLNVPTSHKHCYLPEDVSLNLFSCASSRSLLKIALLLYMQLIFE